MEIKEVSARIILDSRKEETIEISVNAQRTSAPSGKSKGKHEMPCYKINIKKDADFINKNLNDLVKNKKFPKLFYFGDLDKVEKLIKSKVGANTLFAFEASCIKAIAAEQKKQVWQILNNKLEYNLKKAKFPKILSNTIGGGAHSYGKIKPDFQEFLVVCDKNPFLAEKINIRAHEKAEKILSNLSAVKPKLNDENAWQTDLDNEQVLQILFKVSCDVYKESITLLNLGLDCAASQFYHSKTKKYNYKNRTAERTQKEQIDYVFNLIKNYNLTYVEDALEEDDFEGFAELLKKLKENNNNCLIVGDDLTTTNLKRVIKAIKFNSINGLIVKPNQIGSLLEVKRIVDLCQKKSIKIIVSHRSGETKEDFIADLAFALQADFIKTPVIGEERQAKVKRLKEIEASIK